MSIKVRFAFQDFANILQQEPQGTTASVLLLTGKSTMDSPNQDAPIVYMERLPSSQERYYQQQQQANYHYQLQNQQQQQRDESYHDKYRVSSPTSVSFKDPEPHPEDDDEGDSKYMTPQELMRRQKYSLKELIDCLNHKDNPASLPEDLHRRVLDFRLAQQKRLQKNGPTHKWGIYGMYVHLSNIKTDLEWAEDAAYRRQHNLPYLAWSDFDEAQTKGLHNKPWFNIVLIVVCTIMMVVEFYFNDWKIEPLDENPLIGPSAETLVDLGALDTPKIVDEGEWWRLISPVVLHAGLIHWFINILALWFFGRAFEQAHGLVNSLIVFFVPAVGGNILSAIFLPQYISVGASGGIFGFIGGCLADIMVNWRLLFLKDCGEEDDSLPWKRNVGAFIFIVIEVAINIVLGLTPYIDNFIHLGGLVYGICCGYAVIEYTAVNFFGIEPSFWTKVRIYSFRFFGLIVSIVCIVVTCAWLATYEMGDNPCPNCRYFNCIETSLWHCDDCNVVTADLYKNQDASNPIYTRVDLLCPNKVIETINVTENAITERDEIRDELPEYCRSFCAEVFIN